MTFYQWLKRNKSRADGIGDLARDAVRDPNWPRRAAARTPAQVRRSCERYLRSLEVSDDCLRALARAIDEHAQARNQAQGQAGSGGQL